MTITPVPPPNVDITQPKNAHVTVPWYDYFRNIEGALARSEVKFNVKDYGAKGDGTSDDTGPIQAAADALRATQSSTTSSLLPVSPGMLYFPPGTYKVTGSINLQSLKAYGWGVVGSGAVILANCAGKTVFDALGASYGFFRDITIIGSSASVPAIGIQVGRITHDAAPAGGHLFSGVHMDGHFSVADVLNSAGEGNVYLNVQLRNIRTAAEACVMITDGRHHYTPVTDYTPSAWALDEEDSCIQHTFINTDWGVLNGPTCKFTNSSQVNFIGANYMTAANAAAIHFEVGGGAGGNVFRDLNFDVHLENSSTPGMTAAVEFSRPSTNAGTIAIEAFRYRDHLPNVTEAIIKATTPNVTSLLLRRDVDINYGSGYVGAETVGPVLLNTEVINGFRIKDQRALFSIADNASTYFSIGGSLNSGNVEVHVYGSASVTGCAHVNCDAPSATPLWRGSTNFDTTTGALTGTSATTGHLTVSASTLGRVYIENRTGGTQFVTPRVTGS
jgi:hypothetical protein